MIDSVIEAPSFNGLAAVDALLEQLAAVRQLVGPVGSVAVHHRSESSYVVGATIDGVAASVTLAGVASPIGADGLCLRVVGPHTRSDVEVDASTLARPARVSRFAGDGEHIERPVHQNSHRLTLQRVHELLTSGVGSLDYTAAELRQDLATAQVLAQP